jgi:DNA-binding XRE family transcriptional regulator
MTEEAQFRSEPGDVPIETLWRERHGDPETYNARVEVYRRALGAYLETYTRREASRTIGVTEATIDAYTTGTGSPQLRTIRKFRAWYVREGQYCLGPAKE